MKNIFVLFIALFSLTLFNSCRDDGDEWKENGQFAFTIERDNNFIEKAVGEVNSFKFNVNPSYNYSTIPMTFKFTTNLNGSLKLDGNVLVANKEYPLPNKDNIFEYTGNVSGTHQVQIIVKNSKNISKEENFNFTYGTSEFTHTFTGGTADIYQSDPTVYTMKVVPSAGQPTTGYQIRFDTYSGSVKLNGVDVQLGQYYPLPNIDNFTTTLATNQKGQGKLTYSIKNATVTKDYEIQQNVLARQITVESMNISAVNTAPNTSLSLIGVVKKTPITANTTVQYKTWISSASNNNTAGIQNTNNAYTNYALGANGSFTYNFNAIQAGTYTYNIQFKDEFGNESDIKTYNVTVENTLTITTPATASVTLQRTATSLNNQWFQFDIRHKYNGANLNVAAQASTGNGISKIVFELNFNYDGQVINKTYTYNYNSFPPTVDLGNTNTNDGYQLGSWIGQGNTHMINASNGSYTVYVYDKFNNVVSATGTTTVNVIQ